MSQETRHLYKNIILSIFIATYNRKKIIINKVNKLLQIESNGFNVYVLDDASNDGTL